MHDMIVLLANVCDVKMVRLVWTSQICNVFINFDIYLVINQMWASHYGIKFTKEIINQRNKVFIKEANIEYSLDAVQKCSILMGWLMLVEVLFSDNLNFVISGSQQSNS